MKRFFGRRHDVVNYFKNELEHIDEYFTEDDEYKECWREGILETIEEINDLPNNGLEPIVLEIHVMDGNYHILDEEDQLESLKEHYESISQNIQEEETEEEP